MHLASKPLSDMEPPGGLPNEFRLLTLAVRSHIHGDDTDGLTTLLEADLDWELVCTMADWHRLDPLLYRMLQRTRPDLVPKPILERLSGALANTTHYNLMLTSALTRLAALLRDNEIPFLPLKGILLAQQALGDLSLRRSSDLDLLVRPCDARRTLDLLCRELGYVPDIAYSPNQLRLLFQTEKEIKLYSGGLLLELHWRYAQIPETYPSDPTLFSEVCAYQELGGTRFPVLPLPDQFSYLCFHGTRHLWVRLFWLADLGFLINRFPDLDWDAVLSRARALGQEQALALGLALSAALFQLSLPKPALDLIQKTAHTSKYAKEILDLYAQARPAHDYRIVIPIVTTYRWLLRMCPNLTGKATVFYQGLIKPGIPDALAVPLPRILYPLYYVIRPFRLALQLLRRGD